MQSGFEHLVEELRREFGDAHQSRARGNEGRARVCARRAAGWAIGWYAESQALAERHTNALEHLRWFVHYPGAKEELRAAAERLTMKVNPEGKLSHDEDPLEDARLIIRDLLGIDPALI